ncbi:MAG: hypothetical protein ABUT20_23185 [Bacteroidota bacterium]
MNPNLQKRRIALTYLALVPIVTAVLGFSVGHVSYKIYLPLWIINVCLMIVSAWVLGLHVTRGNDKEKTYLAKSAFSLIIPWILISMFAGLGPPPETPAGWVDSSTEQQVRYFVLVIAGVFIAYGFVGLRSLLKNKGDDFYSLVGTASILIAIPLFLINMLFWGFYLTELFRIEVLSGAKNHPDWFTPVGKLFDLVSVVEVALTYIATMVFAISLKKAKLFTPTPCLIYISISLLAFCIVILSAFFSEPFVTAGYAVSIPAIPFVMPYLMGVNLLRRAGN